MSYSVTSMTKGVLAINAGTVDATALLEFTQAAIAAGCTTVTFNHDDKDRLVGAVFCKEVPA